MTELGGVYSRRWVPLLLQASAAEAAAVARMAEERVSLDKKVKAKANGQGAEKQAEGQKTQQVETEQVETSVDGTTSSGVEAVKVRDEPPYPFGDGGWASAAGAGGIRGGG